MGMSHAWETALGVLMPPVNKLINDKKTDEAQAAQNKAGEESKAYMGEDAEYLKSIYEPLLKMGDEQLNALQLGLQNGSFVMDEGALKNYQQYVAPRYEAPAPYQYYPKRQTLANPQQYQDTQQTLKPLTTTNLNYENFQNNQQAPQFNPIQNFEQYQTPQYSGQKYITDYQQYQAPQAPQARQVSDQFQTPTYQQQQQTPQFYQAPNAPDAKYYDPSQTQYQTQQFNLQQDPVYQRRIEAANKATEASAAARGMQLSGATLKALQGNASNIAAEEGQAAFNRYQQQDQTAYQRFQDQQNRTQQAMNYQNEDQYRRYLDSVGIKGSEADKAVQQWNTDRSFGAEQNKETWLREQASKELGRTLNNDEFNQWISTNGQKYSQFADTRDWTTNQSNANVAQDWNQFVSNRDFGRGVYTGDRDFQQNANIQNFQTGQNAYNQNYQNAANTANQNAQNALAYGNQNWNQQLQAQQSNLGQYNINREYGAGQNQQNIQNLLDIYGINNANYDTDRGFNYGVYSDANQNAWDQFKYGADQGLNAYNTNYGVLTDSYNRQAANKANKYGMISDLANLGATGRQDLSKAMTGYYGSMADIGMQQANAYAASQQAKQGGLLSRLGL